MTYPMPWVKLEKYAEMTGDTVEAAKHRIKSGKWQHGNQCKVVDGRIWVDLRAVESWIESWGKPGSIAVARKPEQELFCQPIRNGEKLA